MTFSYKYIHDRLACINIELPVKGRTRKITIYNAYFPWKKDHLDIEILYSLLSKELEHNSIDKFICGDFNCEINDWHQQAPENIGTYSKEKQVKMEDI